MAGMPGVPPLIFRIRICIRESRITLNTLGMKRSSNPKKMPGRAPGVNLRADLRAWRHGHKLSQGKAALKLQISIRTLQEWEQGRAVPRGIALVALRKLITR